jgi:hypothetical protein
MQNEKETSQETQEKIIHEKLLDVKNKMLAELDSVREHVKKTPHGSIQAIFIQIHGPLDFQATNVRSPWFNLVAGLGGFDLAKKALTDEIGKPKQEKPTILKPTPTEVSVINA